MDLVLGIDGGGTKTVAWLAPLFDDDALKGPGYENHPLPRIILGRGQSGPSNPRAVGFPKAYEHITAAIAAAFRDASLPAQTVRAASLGLAGVGREADQLPIRTWAQAQQIAEFVQVTGDAEPIFTAGLSESAGAVLICGTGSLAWGRGPSGDISRTGGWGYLFGDEGSGYAIALAGLRAAVQAADGRRPATELLPAFQRRLNAATPPDLIETVYHVDMTREKIASLAFVVFEAARKDEVASQIVETAAAELSTMIHVLTQRLALEGGTYPLALAGSVVVNQDTLRNRLLMHLRKLGTGPREVRLVSDPVEGAVMMARELALRYGH